MDDDLQEIGAIRKKLGITQSELAKRAGVSQSLIAKIESGRLDPTYSNAKKIFTALGDMQKKEELHAKDVMNQKVISISPHDDIKQTVAKMRKFQISQLPVIDGNSVVGLVSEAGLLDAILGGKSKTVGEIMQESPPIVSKQAGLHAVFALLKYFPVVLVSEKGKLVGLISKADVLAKMYGTR